MSAIARPRALGPGKATGLATDTGGNAAHGQPEQPFVTLGLWAAGLVLTSFGLGVGGPHLLKTGLSVPTLTGLVALVTGLALLVEAARRVLRPMRRWQRVGVAPVGALVALLAAWVMVPGIAATNVPSSDVGDVTPADRGLLYEDVEMRTADGVQLTGWYVPSRNGAAVVMRHGAGSTRASVLDQAAVVAGHGYGVLLVDARGHGDSGGRAMDFGWFGDLDVMAAVDHLAARPDVQPGRIGVVGMSMGGEEAIGAAAADPRIHAVVAEGATGRTNADKAWLSERYGFRGALEERIEWLQYGFTDLLTSASKPTALRDAVATAAPTPFLLIAAGDAPDEQHAAAYLQAAAPPAVDVWVVPGASHTDGLDVEPDVWERRVADFLDRALLGRP